MQTEAIAPTRKNVASRVFSTARALLQEGYSEKALALAQTLRGKDEEEKRAIAYLLCWAHVAQKHWTEAFQAVLPFLSRNTDDPAQDILTDRERLVYHLFHFGVTAVQQAAYEDAELHFTFCLKILHDRRAHLPTIRIQTHYWLGIAFLKQGMLPSASEHFEDALHLCHFYQYDDDLARIQDALCDARQQAGDLLQARIAGQEALHQYEKREDRLQQALIHQRLGRIHRQLNAPDEAMTHYQASLALATILQEATLLLTNCIALAELQLEGGCEKTARHFCQLAQEQLPQIHNPYLIGLLYATLGNVERKAAEHAIETHRVQQLEEAYRYYEQAITHLRTASAHHESANVYHDMAQLAEEMGRTREAFTLWRAGYDMLTRL